MNWILTFITSVFIIVLVSFIGQKTRRKKHPPGPLGLPFFGEKPYLIMRLLFPKWFSQISVTQYFMAMKIKYGDMWSIDLGNKKIITISSYEKFIKAMFDNGNIFSGRPNTKYYQLLADRQGISFDDGDHAAQNRNLALKSSRSLGMVSKQLEEQLCQEVDKLSKHLIKNSSEKVFSPAIFVKPTANIISQYLFNVRFKRKEKALDGFLHSLKILFHSRKENQIIELFSETIPIKYLKMLFPCIKVFINSIETGLEFVNQQCLLRKNIEHEFAKPNCIFDFFWRYRYQNDSGIPLEEKLRRIKHSMFDLYFGGSDTTANMLSFCCLMLGKDQNLQADLRKEIQSALEDTGNFTLDMRKNCPKMLSFLDEIQRYCTLVPQLIYRAKENIVFENYEINKSDFIYMDIKSIFMDAQLFENPYEFDAYRFLDPVKKTYVASKYLVAFGIGRRSCIGKSFGENQMFLFISKLIMQFNIVLPRKTEENFCDITEGLVGLIHSPIEHEIIFQNKSSND